MKTRFLIHISASDRNNFFRRGGPPAGDPVSRAEIRRQEVSQQTRLAEQLGILKKAHAPLPKAGSVTHN